MVIGVSARPARPGTTGWRTATGHPVPTQSLVAWLLTAAEAGLPVSGLAQRDRARSLALYGDALRLALEVDMPDEQALALEGIGECHLRAEKPEDGAAYLGQVLEIFRRLGMQPDAERVEARLAELGEEQGPNPRYGT